MSGTKLRLQHRRGTRAAQPAATSVLEGTLYYVTDEGVLERSSGSAWQLFAITVAALTAGCVPFVAASGALTHDAALTWDSTNRRLVAVTVGGDTLALEAGIDPRIFIAGDSADGAAGQLQLDGYGAQPFITMRRANGSADTPTALADADIVFNFRSVGYDGAASALGGIMRLVANGAWSGSAHGMAFVVLLTANGSTAAPLERFRVEASATITKATVKGAFGHQTGAGGAVAQATSKSTGVTLDKATGAITLNAAALNAATTVSFTLTNNYIEANDIIVVTHKSGGTGGAYTFAAFPGAGSATIFVRNVTAGSLSEAIVLSFTVIKGVVS